MLLLMYSFMCVDQRNKAQTDKTLEQAEAERERLQLKTAETQELLSKNQEALAEAELHNIKVCGNVDTVQIHSDPFFKSNEHSVKSQCLVCSILFHSCTQELSLTGCRSGREADAGHSTSPRQSSGSLDTCKK